MREIIANAVKENSTEFNEAVLGKPNNEYCEWIQNPNSWGGAIEVSILSNFYGIEIDVIDTQSGSISKFGEDKNYPLRVFLIYDGIHYDPLYLESSIDVSNYEIFFQFLIFFKLIIYYYSLERFKRYSQQMIIKCWRPLRY